MEVVIGLLPMLVYISIQIGTCATRLTEIRDELKRKGSQKPGDSNG